MIKNRLVLISLIVFSVVFSVKADIAPDPGYTQVRTALFLETHDDLSDYRFFFNAGAFIQEVKVKKDEVAEVPGGGGAGSSGELLAIPQKSLAGFGKEISNEDIFDLRRQIEENKISGVIELLSHSFNRVVSDGEADNYGDLKYLLKRSDEKGIEIVQLKSDEKTIKKNTLGTLLVAINSRLWMIVAGIFLSLAVISFGILIVRKKVQKSAV